MENSFFKKIMNRLMDLIFKLKLFFISKKIEEKSKENAEMEKLRGRIKNDIRANAKKVMDQLTEVEEVLQKETNIEIHPIIHNVIGEMKKEIQKVLDQPFSGKSKDFQDKCEKYEQWMAKVLLFKETQDQTLLHEACIPYIIEKAIESLEQDLRLIKGYQEHKLETINEEERLTLQDSLQAAIASYFKETFGDHLDQIDSFKNEKAVDIHAIHDWKVVFDDKRQKYLEGVYPTIDEIINAPSREYVDEEETFFNVSSRILKFEFNAARILKELQRDLDKVERKQLRGRIDELENEIQDLQSDLHIPQPHIDRIEAVMESILELHPEETQLDLED